MHVTIRDPNTGGYIELCIPTYHRVAIVIRVRDASDDLWSKAYALAKASGAKVMALLDGTTLPASTELLGKGWNTWSFEVRRL